LDAVETDEEDWDFYFGFSSCLLMSFESLEDERDAVLGFVVDDLGRHSRVLYHMNWFGAVHDGKIYSVCWSKIP